MPCEHYKDALIDTAAGGAGPQGELRAHLASCPSCREAFTQEQSLFAAIDAGLQVAANAEVPPSLVPRVRAALDEGIVGYAGWNSRWLALAGAAAAAALLFAVTFRHNRPGPLYTNKPTGAASGQPGIPAVPAPLTSKSSGGVDSPTRPGRHDAPREELVSVTSAPEVLVPRDQELLVASYARQWSSRKRAPLVATNAQQTAVALLQVPPIQIAELDVKLLSEGNSR